MAELTHERACLALRYDEVNGLLTWANGKPAGGQQRSTGYFRVTLDGVVYKTHRLVWFMATGEWPRGDIDHMDGNPANNAIANLRDVTKAMNIQNQRRAHKNNKLGFLGVHELRGKYRAALWAGGRMRHLGAFDTPELAHAAYLDAKRVAHQGCTV